MKNLTSILLGLVVMGAAFCAKAQTPTYAEQVLVSGVAVSASTATNFGTTGGGVIADVRKQASVAISIIATNAKADAVNQNILYYQKGVNGGSNTWETTLYPIGWTTTAADIDPANPRVIVTNINSWGAGYIRFPYLTNACGSTTNLGFFRLSYGVKISSP